MINNESAQQLSSGLRVSAISEEERGSTGAQVEVLWRSIPENSGGLMCNVMGEHRRVDRVDPIGCHF